MINYNTQTGTAIDKAAAYLTAGELVAIPTETVYGLAANATDTLAVKKVFEVKKRPFFNPLIVHCEKTEQINLYVSGISPLAEKLLQAFSPGPLTILLPGNNQLPDTINNGMRDVAFRIPAHPITQILLNILPFPLVAPSANIFTTISPTTPAHVLKNFNGQIPYILDGGACSVGLESTVVGFDREGMPVIFRQGAITAEQIKEIAGTVRFHSKEENGASPGMTAIHYAPTTPLYLEEDVTTEFTTDKIGVICFNEKDERYSEQNQIVLSKAGNLTEAARHLYDALHQLDERKLDFIIAKKIPNEGIGIAINDRIQRAAHAFKKNSK